MKILVAGTGWLGLPLARKLRREFSAEIHGTTTTEEKARTLTEEGIPTFVYQSGANNRLPETLYDRIILNIPPSDKPHYANAMLELAGLLKPGGQLIFISSTGVYPARPGKIDEQSPTDADHILVHTEKALKERYSETLSIVRFGGLIGPGRHPARSLAGRKGVKDGDAPVNLIQLTDCVELITQLLHDNTVGITVNACASEHPSRRDYYTAAAREFGLTPPEFESGAQSEKFIDNTFLVETLAYRFRKSIFDWNSF